MNQQEVLETTVNNFCAMMKENGPIVRALLLKADGTVAEVNYDSTPRNDHISTILGGSPTIVGELPGKLDGVILTKKYTPDPLVDFPNQHSILAPYGVVLGDVFITRLDENVQPQHFGLLEWNAYMSSKDSSSAPETMAEFKDGDSEDGNEEVYDEEHEEEEVDPEDAVMHAVVNAFMAKNGGAVPTAEQVADILDRMGFNVVDNLTVEEEREYLIEAYEAEHGVKPTNEQLEDLMKKLPLTKTAHLMSMDYPEDDDDDEDYVPTDIDEEENDMDELLAQAQSMVMDFPKMVLPGSSKHDIQNGKKPEKLANDIELGANANEKKNVDDLDGVGQVLKSG